MQKFEFSKISKSTFNVEQTITSRPKILQTFLNSLDKSIKFNIYSDIDFQKLSNDEIVFFDEYGHLKINIPKDPRPWEIMQIVNLIDNYTIADSEIEGELKGVVNLIEIADRFLSLSYYLISNLDYIQEYKDIVIEMIFDFYNFGNSLKSRALCDLPSEYDLNFIPQLSEEEEQEAQKWLYGTDVYTELEKKFNKKIHYNLINKIPLTYEENQNYKINSLNKYFKDLVTNPYKLKQLKNKSFSFRNYESDYLKTPLGNIFLQNINKSINKLTENLSSMVLSNNFYHKAFNSFTSFLGTYFLKEQEKFFSKPEFLLVKKELLEAKNFTDLEIISRVELDAIRKIQNEILNFPYRRVRSITTETLSDEMLSYLTSLILSYNIFSELKLSFNISDIHLRSVFMFKLSNNLFYWIDLTPPVGDRFNFKITDNLLVSSEIDFEKIKEHSVSVMKWCHTYNLSGKRLQPYSTLTQNASSFVFSFLPPELAIKTLPLRLLNSFKS